MTFLEKCSTTKEHRRLANFQKISSVRHKSFCFLRRATAIRRSASWSDDALLDAFLLYY